MPFFDGARGRMHYRRWPIDRPQAVMVLLPGLGQHSGHYHRFARSAGASAIEMWALDTAGHGLSEGNETDPGSLGELVMDALRLIEVARADRVETPLLVMGHSLGAVTALGLLGAAVPEITEATDLAAVQAKYPLAASLPAETLTGLVLCGVPERALGGGTPGALGTALPRHLPVLVVHGVEDRRAPIDAVRAWTGRHESVHLREYVDAGHDLLHEPVHPRVTADITEWVRSVIVGMARYP